MFIDRILAVIVSYPECQSVSRFELHTDRIDPLVVPVEVLVSLGIRPVQPLCIGLYDKVCRVEDRIGYTEPDLLGCLEFEIVQGTVPVKIRDILVLDRLSGDVAGTKRDLVGQGVDQAGLKSVPIIGRGSVSEVQISIVNMNRHAERKIVQSLYCHSRSKFHDLEISILTCNEGVAHESGRVIQIGPPVVYTEA